MPKMSRHEIYQAQRQHEEETLHDDALNSDAEIWDQVSAASNEDKELYEGLKAAGYSNDQILAHMFPDGNSAHRNCHICLDAQEYGKSLAEYFEALFKATETDPEARTMLGNLFNKYASDEAKTPVKEISGGFLN